MEYWRPEEIKFMEENEDIINASGGLLTRELVHAVYYACEDYLDYSQFFFLKFMYGLHGLMGFELVLSKLPGDVATMKVLTNKHFMAQGEKQIDLLSFGIDIDNRTVNEQIGKLIDQLEGILDEEYKDILLPHEDKIYREILSKLGVQRA